MNESVRAFLAIELRENVKAALAGLLGQLERARVSGLRLVNPDGIHLTLKFFGDIERTQVESITGHVSRAVLSHRPFTLELGEVGVFPSIRSPRVLWVGIEGDTKPLRELYRRTEDALEKLGYARDTRAFSPHLTLGRIGNRTPPVDRRRAAEALFSAEFEPGVCIEVACVSLMRSILRPDGARYERLAQMPLAGNMSER